MYPLKQTPSSYRHSSRILRLAMRRLMAISITLLLGFALAAPLFANSSSSLPQCCRRNGVHRCAGGMTRDADRSVSSIESRCPAFPRAIAAPALHGFALTISRGPDAPLFAHPSAAPQTEAHYRIAFARSRQKRGPPAFLL
jgi:hypothetical protein